jgi:hypothetical protein
MANKLTLTRNQLAAFLGDHEQIKQFERLIALVQEYLNSGMVDGLDVTGGNAITGVNANAAAIQALADTLDRAPPAVDLSPIEARLSALEAIPPIVDLSGLESRVSGLEIAPSHTPEAKAKRYGSFYDTTDQTAAVINTAYAITLNTTDLSSGVTIGTPTSRVYVDRSEVYNIQFSAQFINTAGGAHRVWIWLRKNGTNVPDSTGAIKIEGNNTELIVAWNYLLKMNAGDYFELMWEVSDTSVALHYDAATAVHPAIPSIIVTVTDNIEGG